MLYAPVRSRRAWYAKQRHGSARQNYLRLGRQRWIVRLTGAFRPGSLRPGSGPAIVPVAGS